MSKLDLYEKVNNSSGQDRIGELHALREQLLDTACEVRTLFEGLKQRSNDVQKVVLDAICIRAATETYDKLFLISVIAILRRFHSTSQSISTTRTTASALRCLSVLLKHGRGANPLTSTEVQDIVDIALTCLSCGLSQNLPTTSSGRCGSSTSSVGPGSALDFGRNGGATPVHSMQKRGSITSLSSQISVASISSTNIADQSGGSDDEAKQSDGLKKRQGRLVEAKKSVRYRSMMCISVLNERAGRLLLIHWPSLLVNSRAVPVCSSLMDATIRDEALSNRISAVHTVQAIISSGAQSGFMAGAEERSRLSAFTSLSSTIAFVIVDLRKRLLHLLLDKNSPVSLLEAVIKCTKTLVISTSQVKLHAAHSEVLRPVTLRLCSHADASIAVPAYSLLTAFANGQEREEQASGDDILSTLKDQEKSIEVRIGAWTALTASMNNAALLHATIKPVLQEAIQAASPLALRQAAALYVQASMIKFKDTYDHDTIHTLSIDVSPIIRAVSADCLAVTDEGEEILATLLGDAESTVRASAIRAIGVKIQNRAKVHQAKEYISRLLQDKSLLVRMRASWALGNLCEQSEEWSFLLQQCYSLHQDDEKVSINAIRGIGAVLSRCPVEVILQSESVIVVTLSWLISSLSSGTPKVRWNAATCLARSFESEVTSKHLLSLCEVTEPLTRCLIEDKAFKVRLSIAQAMLALVQHRILPVSSLSQIKAAVREAIVRVDSQMRDATFKEIQLHALPLQQLLDRLMQALPN